MSEETKAKRARLLENVIGAVRGAEEAEGNGKETADRGVLTGRMESANRTHAQQKERRTFLRIPANRCRVWPGNPRQQRLLNETSCADLIEGFRARGQDFAAIVRPISDGPDHDFEVIVGSRRRWTAEFLSVPLLVEVREQLNDEQAFALSHSENEDHVRPSDYEEALGMKRALGSYYRGQMTYQAQVIGKSVDHVSRLLDLAELPEEIVEAYPSLFEIKIAHMRLLKPFLENPQTRERILDRATTAKGKYASGATLIKHLLTADRPRKGPSKNLEIKTGTNKPLLSAKYSRGRVAINVNLKAGASGTEISKAVKRAVEWAQRLGK